MGYSPIFCRNRVLLLASMINVLERQTRACSFLCHSLMKTNKAFRPANPVYDMDTYICKARVFTDGL